jgi:type IV secretory pathway VirB4 component
VQDLAIREALEHFTVSGPLGRLLDADSDSLGDSDFMVFELEELMNMGERAVVPVLFYIFRQIEKRLDGRPTVIPIDEAWVAFRDPRFTERIRMWLKLLRDKNASVWMFTQSLADAVDSPIFSVIVESCPTKILLPNAEAKNPAVRRIYEAIGMTDAQVDLIATATPKRDYYYTSPLGKRLFSLGLGPVALSFVGSGGKENVTKVAGFVREHGAQWPAHWLRARGLADWADYWLQLSGGH